MPLRIDLRRWNLGLHGLALLRDWPFGNPVEAEDRMTRMRDILDERVGVETEIRDVDDLGPADAYRDWSATYDEPNPLIASEEVALRSLLDDVPAGRALDVAAGTGRIAAILVQRGHQVVAVDASLPMLAVAAEKNLGVPHAGAHIARLPFLGTSFDLVVCGLALTHVPDLVPVFDEFARVLRPGGSLVTSDIHPMAVTTGGHGFFRRSDGTRGVTRNLAHWPSAYVRAATAAGLIVQECVETFVDEDVLRGLGVEDMYLQAEAALKGLPLALLWRFVRPDA